MDEGMTNPNWEPARWRESDNVTSDMHQSTHTHNQFANTAPHTHRHHITHNQHQHQSSQPAQQPQQQHHHHSHHPQHAHTHSLLHQPPAAVQSLHTSSQHNGMLMNSYGRHQQHPPHTTTPAAGNRAWDGNTNTASAHAPSDVGISSSNPSATMGPSNYQEPYAENYDYRGRVQQAHGNHPQQPNYTQDSATAPSSAVNQSIMPNDAWRNLQRDRHSTGPPSGSSDGSLTLQIPRGQDFRRAPPPEPSHRQLEGLPFSVTSSPQPQPGPPAYPYGHVRQPQQHQPAALPPALPGAPSVTQPTPTATTPPGQSLPSFASFREHTNRDETVESVDAASIGPHLSCFTCTKVKPMVRDVAVAVVELDEDIALLSNKPDTRAAKFPVDSSVATARWILERLKDLRTELQESGRRGQIQARMGYSTADSPPNSLKRSSEQWERDDGYDPKRSRSGISPNTYDDRRSSLEFLTHKPSYQRLGLSSPSTESIPGSTYPKPSTPPLSTRHGRPLPPPSPLSYLPSAAVIQTPLTAHSMESTSNYQSLGPAQTSPSASQANSAQIAELQHQIGLKSLALQTLQGEYASLLQKLQKERVKNQTIERKTTMSDHEVNELTTKNEELSERVKALEEQVEEGEKRRETDRANAAREKEQWGRMLEMSGRLQARHSEDKQKLADKNADLQKRIASIEQPSPPAISSSNDRPLHATSPAPQRATSYSTDATGVTQQENDVLRERIHTLTTALNEVSRQAKIMDIRARDLLQQNDNVESTILKALKEVSMPSPRPYGAGRDMADPHRGKASTHAPASSTLRPSFVSPPESTFSTLASETKVETQPSASPPKTLDNTGSSASVQVSSLSDHSPPAGGRDAGSESPRSTGSDSTNLLRKYASAHGFGGMIDSLPTPGMPPPPRPVVTWEGGY